MPNNYFQFKQFRIIQEKSAMKVGTDGVLLGAYANASNAKNILDIGSGTGLISLMLAQKNPNATIFGIELDHDAYKESLLNIKESPWNNISIIHTDFFAYKTNIKFDLIVSNPPFFKNSFLSGKESKDKARHCIQFDIYKFFAKSKKLLTSKGRITIIYPSESISLIETILQSLNLFITHIVCIKPTPKKQAKRIILEITSKPEKINIQEFIIEKYGRHKYSEEYINLTKDYYLSL